MAAIVTGRLELTAVCSRVDLELLWLSGDQHKLVKRPKTTTETVLSVPSWANALLVYAVRETGECRQAAAGALRTSPRASVHDGDGTVIGTITWPDSKAVAPFSVGSRFKSNCYLDLRPSSFGVTLPVWAMVQHAAACGLGMHTPGSAGNFVAALEHGLPHSWVADEVRLAALSAVLPALISRYKFDTGLNDEHGGSTCDMWSFPFSYPLGGLVASDCDDLALMTVAHWNALKVNGPEQIRRVLEGYQLHLVCSDVKDDLTGCVAPHAYCVALPRGPDSASVYPLVLDGTALLDPLFAPRVYPSSQYHRGVPIAHDSFHTLIASGAYAPNYRAIYMTVNTDTLETNYYKNPLTLADLCSAKSAPSPTDTFAPSASDIDACDRWWTQFSHPFEFADDSKIEAVDFSAQADSREWYICRGRDADGALQRLAAERPDLTLTHHATQVMSVSGCWSFSLFSLPGRQTEQQTEQ